MTFRSIGSSALRLHRRLGGILIVAAFGGCGGGGGGSGGSDSAAAGADYFPLAVGNRWSFTEGTDLVSDRVTEVRTAGGRSVFVVRSDSAGGFSEEYYARSASDVVTVAGADSDPLRLALGDITLLQLPLQSGNVHIAFDRTLPGFLDADGDGRPDTLQLRAVTTVVGFETVGTPAGTFTQAAHVQTAITQTLILAVSGQAFTANGVVDEWYAPDIGPVRRVTVWTGTVADGRTEDALRAFSVGLRRSESVAPHVVAISPLDGSIGRDALIRVSFSEAMDRFFTAGTGAVVADRLGRSIQGGWIWVEDGLGRTLVYSPDEPLPDDTFSVQLPDGLQDLAANALSVVPPWRFELDARGPSVVAMEPAPDSIEVPLNGVIRLTFDEAPDPAGFSANMVFLQESVFAPPVPISVSLEGRILTIVPSAPLVRGKNYTVSVDTRLTDRFGNPGQPFSATFKTDPGRFAAPRALNGVGLVFGAAIADFNADGRADVVLSATPVSGGAIGLYLALQQPDGTLAAAVNVPAALACQPSGLATGDFDNDGRLDLLTGGFCGIQVLSPAAGGGLVEAAFIDFVAFNVRWIPIAADGARLAIVGTDSNGDLRLWRQTTPGAFDNPSTLPRTMVGVNDIAIADFDGDGRPDVALSGQSAPTNRPGISVLVQQADGSFVAAREMPVDLVWGASSLAAGDFNGDGRNDIVFTTGGNSPTVIGLFLQQGDGSFGPLATLPTYDSPAVVVAADLNGDGRTDVVVGHIGWNAVGVYLQRGDGTLAAEERFESTYGNFSVDGLAVGDLNADGLPDIVSFDALLLQRPAPQAPSALTPGANRSRALLPRADIRSRSP